MTRRSIKDDISGSRSILALFVVALLVISTVGAYVFLFASPNAEASVGDYVTVDYVGMFADGRVFDTSMWSVASDGEVPKSLFFSGRAGESSYTPFLFKIGGRTAIMGFDQGIRGMKVGETRTFTIPVEEGYGKMDEGLKRIMSLDEELEQSQALDREAFKELFGEYPATSGGQRTITHARLGITATYQSTGANLVEVYFRASPGDVCRACSSDKAGGWDVRVISIDEGGIIHLQHQLAAEDDFRVRGYDVTGLASDGGPPKTRVHDFYIDEVDADAGTFVMNYNSEVVGRELTFTVTLLSIA